MLAPSGPDAVEERLEQVSDPSAVHRPGAGPGGEEVVCQGRAMSLLRAAIVARSGRDRVAIRRYGLSSMESLVSRACA